jgi:hypothetical protein
MPGHCDWGEEALFEGSPGFDGLAAGVVGGDGAVLAADGCFLAAVAVDDGSEYPADGRLGLVEPVVGGAAGFANKSEQDRRHAEGAAGLFF